MNTPPTIKRHTVEFREIDMPDGHYLSGLVDDAMGGQYANMVTSFEHLEDHMSRVLAVLLGGHDVMTAGYVLRTIRNPATKKDILWALLEKAKINKDLPADYDEVLREYQRLASQRNQLVHGKWFTYPGPPLRVFVCRSNDHGYYFFDLEEVQANLLMQLALDMSALLKKILLLTQPVLYKRKHGEEPPLPRRAPTTVSSTDPQPSPKEPEPPPQSSEE